MFDSDWNAKTIRTETWLFVSLSCLSGRSVGEFQGLPRQFA